MATLIVEWRRWHKLVWCIQHSHYLPRRKWTRFRYRGITFFKENMAHVTVLLPTSHCRCDDVTEVSLMDMMSGRIDSPCSLHIFQHCEIKQIVEVPQCLRFSHVECPTSFVQPAGTHWVSSLLKYPDDSGSGEPRSRIIGWVLTSWEDNDSSHSI